MNAVLDAQLQLPAPVARRCYGCKRILPRSEFSRSSRNNDGILHLCRICNSNHAKEWAKANPDKYRARLRAWTHTERGKTTTRRWVYADRAKNPERHRARSLLWSALQTGKVIRQPCEVCGDANTHGHHDDYSKPLDVRWLCRRHHYQYHAEHQS